MLSTSITKRIVNVIATADLKQKVDVTKFNQYQWGLYDLECYGGKCGYIKDGMMHGKVSVFFSGKFISVGTKSIDGAEKELFHALKLMVDAQMVKPIELKITIQNIVGMVDLGHVLDIAYIAKKLPKSIYEPEQFSGVIHRTSTGSTLLIFSSGKIVVFGAKSEKQIDLVASMITTIMQI